MMMAAKFLRDLKALPCPGRLHGRAPFSRGTSWGLWRGTMATRLTATFRGKGHLAHDLTPQVLSSFHPTSELSSFVQPIFTAHVQDFI